MNAWPVWAAALWWGSLTTLGLWVVPLLFVHLPTAALAGAMAARLFEVQTWVSAVLGAMLLLASRSHRWAEMAPRISAATVWIIAGVLMALLVEFAVAPRIVGREDLRLWHAVGSTMFVLQWICAGATFWNLVKRTSRLD